MSHTGQPIDDLHDACSIVIHLYSIFFFSSRRRHTRFDCDWSSDVCSSDLNGAADRFHSLSLLRIQRVQIQHRARSVMNWTRNSKAQNPNLEQFPNEKPPEKIGRASCRERV